MQMICRCLRMLLVTSAIFVISCCSKIQIGVKFCYQLTQVVLECWLLSVCVCGHICVCSGVFLLNLVVKVSDYL